MHIRSVECMSCTKILPILPFSFLALVNANTKAIKRHTETNSFRETIAFAERLLTFSSKQLVISFALYVLFRLVSQAQLKVPGFYTKLS